MNYVQEIICLLILVTFVSIYVTNVNAVGATYRMKQRKQIQQKCNEEIMEKKYITINDKIVCDKTITTEYMKKICPRIIELTLKDITEYYTVLGLTKEEFHEDIKKNISDAYMSEVYIDKHIPTYRHNMTLHINIHDVYTYQKNHCGYYFLSYKHNQEYEENLNRYKQMVHQHRTIQNNMITIEAKPRHNVDHYDFQTSLCPIIKELLITNKTQLNSNKLMNKILIVQNITKEYMHRVYTKENFKEMKQDNIKLKIPSIEDIYKYEKKHCRDHVVFYNIVEVIIILIYICVLTIIVLMKNVFKINNKYKSHSTRQIIKSE
jgi:hypothetical protein